MPAYETLTFRLRTNFHKEVVALDVAKGHDTPIPVPEAALLMAIHRNEANPNPVYDIKVVGKIIMPKDQMMEYLASRGYPKDQIKAVYSPHMPVLPERASDVFDPELFAAEPKPKRGRPPKANVVDAEVVATE